jgi:replicative DNA helicase
MAAMERVTTLPVLEPGGPGEGLKHRQPPHNIEAEQALLGAILVNNEAHLAVSTFLEAQHFYDPVHARIYEACAKLIGRGQLATPITLKSYFEQDAGLAEVGGAAYLARLAGAAAAILNAEDYGRAIYDLAIRRALIQVGQDIVLDAYDAPIESAATDQIEQAEHQLYALAERGRYEGGFRPFSTTLTSAIDMAAHAYERDGGLSGIATGFVDLDKVLGGLHPSDLLILAGRPSMGKTALGTNIAFHAALAAARALRDGRVAEDGRTPLDGAVVGLFSLEMSAEQLATRILSEQASIPSERIRRGNLDETQFRELVRVSQELNDLPLYIDDTGALSISALTARARRLKRQQGLGLLVIDYLQLMRSSGGSRQDNRVQEVSEISRGLKALAKELNVPVMALSQLSRAVEQRDDKRPQLADLRESGSIEQDADVVMFVFREEYYVMRREPREGTPEHADWQAEMEKIHGVAEIIIGKQRNGPTGTVPLSFQGEVTRFGNLARDSHLPTAP